MQIYMDIKNMIDLFLHITSLLIFLHELKASVQVYKPSVILEPIVHADTQNQISLLKHGLPVCLAFTIH